MGPPARSQVEMRTVLETCPAPGPGATTAQGGWMHLPRGQPGPQSIMRVEEGKKDKGQGGGGGCFQSSPSPGLLHRVAPAVRPRLPWPGCRSRNVLGHLCSVSQPLCLPPCTPCFLESLIGQLHETETRQVLLEQRDLGDTETQTQRGKGKEGETASGVRVSDG